MKKLHLTILLAIFCLSINAQTTFQKTYGNNSQYSTIGSSLIQTNNGEYILSGRWGVNTSYDNGFLIKVNSLGDTLWTKKLPMSSSAISTLDGGFRSNFSKFNSLDNLMWNKLYPFSTPYPPSFLLDGSEKFIQTKDSGYVFLHPTGFCPSSMCGIHYGVLRTDKNGNALWLKDYGNNSLTTSLSEGFSPSSIIQTHDNNFLICGYYYLPSYTNGFNPHILKINQNGDTLWAKGYRFDTLSSISFSGFFEIISTPDSGFIVLGTGRGNDSLDGVIVCKLDSAGNPQWTKKYIVNSDKIWSPKISETSDGGYAITGDAWDLSVTNSDVGLMKVKSNGDTLWVKTYGTVMGVEWGTDIIEAANGSLAITGGIDNTAGGYDALLLIVDSLGNGCNQNYTNTTVANLSATITHPPLMTYTLQVTDSTGSYSFNSIPVLTTIPCPPVVTSINQTNPPLQLITNYPNPFSSSTTLQTDKFFKDATLTVYNSFGQQVKQIKNLSGQTITLHRDNLSSGLYFIRLTQDNKIISADKLVITD